MEAATLSAFAARAAAGFANKEARGIISPKRSHRAISFRRKVGLRTDHWITL